MGINQIGFKRAVLLKHEDIKREFEKSGEFKPGALKSTFHLAILEQDTTLKEDIVTAPTDKLYKLASEHGRHYPGARSGGLANPRTSPAHSA